MLSTNTDVLSSTDTYGDMYNRLCDSLRSTIPQEMIDNPEDFNYMYRVAARDQIGNIAVGDSIEIMWGFRRKNLGDCPVEGNPNLAYQ